MEENIYKIEILAAAIVEVVKEYLALVKAGKNFNIRVHLDALEILKKKIEKV